MRLGGLYSLRMKRIMASSRRSISELWRKGLVVPPVVQRRGGLFSTQQYDAVLTFGDSRRFSLRYLWT